MIQARRRAAAALLLWAAAVACGAPQAAVVPLPATAAEVQRGVTDVVELWRQGWEARSADALAALYVPGLDVNVAVQGKLYSGATTVTAALRERFGRMKHAKVQLSGLTVLSLGEGAAAVTASIKRRYGDGVTTIDEEGVVTFALVFHDGKWLIAGEHVSY